MLKSSKYLLAVGDSFTDADFQSTFYPDYDCSYAKWPEVLAQKMNISKVVNLGRSGASNEYIFDTAIDHLLENLDKIEMVAIGTTEIWRFTPYNRWFINPVSIILQQWPPHEPKSPLYESIDPYVKFIMSHLVGEKHGEHTIRIFLRDYVNQVLRMQRLCKKLNIRLVISNILGPFSWATIDTVAREIFNTTLPYDRERAAEQILSVEGFYDVDPASFCGWPCFPQLGGKPPTCIHNSEWNHEEMTIGPKDGHPNALGHIHIADKIYEHIQKNNL